MPYELGTSQNPKLKLLTWPGSELEPEQKVEITTACISRYIRFIGSMNR